jgi:hypothetical protein
MQAQAEHGTELVETVDFDAPSKKGWDFFTKFLLWNIIIWGGVLVLLAIIFAQ